VAEYVCAKRSGSAGRHREVGEHAVGPLVPEEQILDLERLAIVTMVLHCFLKGRR